MATDNNIKPRRKSLFRILRSLGERFDLKKDSASQSEVLDNITKGIEFRGTNLWILIFATFTAALGLNVNSTVVIIGAMLISPLMGPIMGVGVSLGINDFIMFKKSLRNFAWMVVISILTSVVYFFIFPVTGSQSELLARTNPTTYDVMIAFVGGVAGMVAQTRKERGMAVISVILGVAIATTLLPPLCTIGFGITSGSLRIIWGASYLFLINTVFIALATYLVVILLKFDKHIDKNDTAAGKRVKRYMGIFTVVTIIPSAFLTLNIMNSSRFESNAEKFIYNVFQFSNTVVVDKSVEYKSHSENSVIEVVLVGEELSLDVMELARAQMDAYGLKNTELIIRQATQGEKPDFMTLQSSYAEIIKEKNQKITELEGIISTYRQTDTLPSLEVSRELGILFDNVKSVSLSLHYDYNTQGIINDTLVVAIVHRKDTGVAIDKERIRKWLGERVNNNNVILYTAIDQ